MPRLSVIIPVYQSEAYIDRCLDSVRKQTLADIEIICVNDGSTDASMEKMRRHASEDDRIVLVDQENQGPSAARNAGLDIATGDYVGFLDSDDYVGPDYYGSMLDMAVSHDADILLNNHVIREESGGSHLYRGSYYSKQLAEGEFLDKYFAADNTVCLLYAHLYRASLIRDRHVRFPIELYCQEDEFFHRVVHYYADRVYAYSGPEYHYVAHTGSIMASRVLKNIGYVKSFSALRDYFGDLICDKSFRMKLFCPMLYSEISEEKEFLALREYILSLQEYISRSSVFISDFDRFAMRAVMESTSVEECNARLGRIPFARYQTRGRMKAREKVSVSVIIPAYNTEKEISRCLESVCSQTTRDIEIICVDDCSSDRTVEVMTGYANNDVRIRIVRLPVNSGVSAARNKGLELASGKYICFVDSDDWIDSDFIETLMKRIEAAGTQVATDSSYIMEYPEKGTRSFSSFDWVPEDGGNLPSAMVQRLFPPVIWASIYRREYLEANNILFPDVKYGGEDIYFAGVCNLLTDRVHIFRGPAYHYLQRQGSLIRSKGRGFEYLKNFRAMRLKALEHGASLEGAKLFYVESLFIEDEQMFDFTREFMHEIRDEVGAHPEIYTDQDRFLMDVMLNTPDYAAFKAKYNPNISMSFIRSRMAQKR